MAPVIPFLADTRPPFKQILAAEQTSQSIQTWIHEKRDAIQAIKKRAIDEEIPYDIVHLDIEWMEKEISKYKLLLKWNEISRFLWRGYHMSAWRVTVRPLKVIDLPHEILTMIFANFEDIPIPPIQVEPSSSDQCLPEPDVASIRNIRLTCRSFCEAGSRFLLPVVDISFTRSSVQRLEEISNHPTISKGVRIIQVHADAYNASLANNWEHFCTITLTKLRILPTIFAEAAARAQREVTEECFLVGLIPEPKSLKIRGREMALKDVQDLIRIVQKHKDRDPSVELRLDPFETKISKALVQAHEEYSQKFLEQQSLAQDAQIFAYISTAIGLMPSVQRLAITETCGPRRTKVLRANINERLNMQEWKSALKSRNLFRRMMVNTSSWNPKLLGWSGQPPFSLVLKLPLVLQAGSRNLTQLDIEIPPLMDSFQVIAAGHLQNLRHACQQLKSVQIRLSRSVGASLFSQWCLAATYTLLEAMLASPELEVVKLDLKGKYAFRDYDESVAPLLASISWDKLRTLHLAHISIEVDELRELLATAPDPIHLDLSDIYLLEGSWADALEVLRGRADSSSRVVKPHGTELEALRVWEIRHVWDMFDSERRDGWYSAQRCPGPASYYIRGGDVPNPLIWFDD